MLLRVVAAAVVCITFGWAISSPSARQAASPGQTNRPGVPAAPATPETPATGTAVVRGRVVAADTGAPLRRAQIRLGTFGSGVLGTLTGTDDQGRFEYTGVARGTYTLTAALAGYVQMSLGQRRATDPARPIDLSDGQMFDTANFTLQRAGMIVVRLTDDLGEPFARARVRLEQYKFIDGVRQMTYAFDNSGSETDETGTVRFTGVPPGEYCVSAMPLVSTSLWIESSDSRRILAPTFYPGVTSPASAERIPLAIGQDVSVSYALAAVRTIRVSGVVRSSTPGSVRSLRLSPRGYISTQSGPTTTPAPDGSFVFSDVVPGNYTLWTPNLIAGGGVVVGLAPQGEFGMAPLTVTGDLDQVVLTTSPGVTMRGRIVFEESRQGSTARRDRLSIQKLNAGDSGIGMPRGQFRLNSDDTFELSGLAGPGVLRVSDDLFRSGWFLRSVRIDGRDVTDAVLEVGGGDINNVEIRVTQAQSEVSGTVTDERNAASDDFVVVVFPQDSALRTPRSRYMAIGRPDQGGRYRVLGLPPGRYLGAAVRTLEEGEEQDAKLLERLQDVATPFSLVQDQAVTINLKLLR